MEGPRELYQYSDLHSPSQEMRLLNLAPALEHEAELHCSLSPVSLPSKPKYEALSYVWGSTENLQPLICDGKLLRITQNLATALRYCRKRKSPRRLWVDAVCIDQSNVKEKTEQIELMAAIFSRARRTFIWLGEPRELISEGARAVKPDCKAVTSPENAVEDLFQVLRAFGELLWMDEKMLNIWLSLIGGTKMVGDAVNGAPVSRNLMHQRRTLLGRLLKRSLAKKDPDYEILWELLLKSPWFKRVWTIQELLLSPCPVLLCGSSRVSAPTFSRAAEVFEFNGIAILASMRLSLWPVYSSWFNKKFTRYVRRLDIALPDLRKFFMDVLLVLLGVICSSMATEPSDYVVGSLAVLQTFGAQLPPPYYSCSTTELYARATRSLFRYGDSLGLLMLICEQPLLRSVSNGRTGESSVTDRVLTLPSWALDWRRPFGPDGRLDYLHPLHAAGVNLISAPANATRFSRFEDWSKIGSGDELVLNGRLLQDSPTQFQYIAASLHSQQSVNATSISHWATWALFFRSFFGPGAVDQTRIRLEESMRLLIPVLIDIRKEFDVMWSLASDVFDRSNGELGNDVYKLVSESKFQQLFYPSGSNMLDSIAEHLSRLALVVTSAGAIGFCIARSATSQGNGNRDRPGSSSYEDTGDFEAPTDLNGCVIALVAGLDFPLLLRAVLPYEGKHHLISVAVLSGMMQGEAWPLNREDLHPVVLI